MCTKQSFESKLDRSHGICGTTRVGQKKAPTFTRTARHVLTKNWELHVKVWNRLSSFSSSVSEVKDEVSSTRIKQTKASVVEDQAVRTGKD